MIQPKKINIIFLIFAFFQLALNVRAGENLKQKLDSLKMELYRNHDPKKNVILHFNISLLNFASGDFLSAENYGYKAKNLAIKFKLDKNLMEICEHLGNLKMSRGDYSGAIDEYQQALRLVEKTNDKIRMALVNGNIGTNHWYMGNFDEALKYYKKSYKLSELMDDYEGMLGQLNNIGLIYRKKGELKIALRYYESSLKLCVKLENETGHANALNNIGIVYQYENKFDDAIKKYEESLEIRKKIHDDIGISTSLGNLGSLYLVKKDYIKAEKFLLDAFEISEKVNDLEGIRELSFNLADLYDLTGSNDEAYKYFKIYISARDSLNNEENKREAYQKELNFNFETEKLKLDQAREKEEIQNQEKEKIQQIILYSISFGSLMVILFAIFIFRKFKESKRQNTIIEQQKHLVEEKQKEIIDSITYAKRLQHAILTPESEIKKHFPESLLFYRPKDIVAGDFYFFETTTNHIFYAAADCTGHGVPGAMVSIVCSNALTRSVKEFNLHDPGAILDKTRELILETFNKSGEDVKDGMDISLISIDKNTKSIKWSGANNPLWYIENNMMKEITADKQPIGKVDIRKPFTTHSLPDRTSFLFLFTDGFADQFGGPMGKKFKYAKLQKLLFENINHELSELYVELETAFSHWKGNLEQVDDVCIIGLKI